MRMNIGTTPRGGRTRAGVTLVSGLLLAGGLAACSAPAAPNDRSGGATLTLHLATSDGAGTDPNTSYGPRSWWRRSRTSQAVG